MEITNFPKCFLCRSDVDRASEGTKILFFHANKYDHCAHISCMADLRISFLASRRLYDPSTSSVCNILRCPVCFNMIDGMARNLLVFQIRILQHVLKGNHEALQRRLDSAPDLNWSVDEGLYACLHMHSDLPSKIVNILLATKKATPKYGLTFAYGFFAMRNELQYIPGLRLMGALRRSQYLLPFFSRSSRLLCCTFPSTKWTEEVDFFCEIFHEILLRGNPDVAEIMLGHLNEDDTVFGKYASFLRISMRQDNLPVFRNLINWHKDAWDNIRDSIPEWIALAFTTESVNIAQYLLSNALPDQIEKVLEYSAMVGSVGGLKVLYDKYQIDLGKNNNYLLKIGVALTRKDFTYDLIDNRGCNLATIRPLLYSCSNFKNIHGRLYPRIASGDMACLVDSKCFLKPELDFLTELITKYRHLRKFLDSC